MNDSILDEIRETIASYYKPCTAKVLTAEDLIGDFNEDFTSYEIAETVADIFNVLGKVYRIAARKED